MAKRNIKSPLSKRIPREFLGDWKKYLVVALLLVVMVGVVSGMYVANNSMKTALDNLEGDYTCEDGNFELTAEATPELIDAITDSYEESISIYANPYVDFSENEDVTVRVYAYQNDVNIPAVHEGRLPSGMNEVAIDRMHADNADIKVGDSINIGGEKMEVTGLISLPNYTALYRDNNSIMFDAFTFDVALVVPEQFTRISEGHNVHHVYSWIYDTDPTDDSAEVDLAEELMECVLTQGFIHGNPIAGFQPAITNQAITFAPGDISKDMKMCEILLYIFILIIAFVFGVTITTSIIKEASVIGTLRASGYSRTELLIHYMTMPVLVTLISAIIGNILGYTVLKDVVANLYYNSYSLPVYKTLWNGEAFVRTTIVPTIIIIVLNAFIISRKLRMSPLKFLRHDFKKRSSKGTVKLPSWKFFSRFRARVLIQNKSNYLVLFVGVIFIMFLMCFAFGMPDTLDNISKTAPDSMLVNYQVILKTPVDEMGNEITTDNGDAEKAVIGELIYKSSSLDEGITVYGFDSDSRYFEIENQVPGEVIISSDFAGKYGLSKGDAFTLSAEFDDSTYDFKVASVSDNTGALSIYMNIDEYCRVFDTEEGYFNSYISESAITDISDKYIAKTIELNDILAMADQLDHSMGDMMSVFQYACAAMAAILIYLLTKIIIEKNENSISMTKILGYKNSEIASLYLVSTTIVMLITEVIGLVIGIAMLKVVWKVFLRTMPGWYECYISNESIIKIFILIFIGYMIIMLFDYRRIRKIPMDEALKSAAL